MQRITSPAHCDSTNAVQPEVQGVGRLSSSSSSSGCSVGGGRTAKASLPTTTRSFCISLAELRLPRGVQHGSMKATIKLLGAAVGADNKDPDMENDISLWPKGSQAFKTTWSARNYKANELMTAQQKGSKSPEVSQPV